MKVYVYAVLAVNQLTESQDFQIVPVTIAAPDAQEAAALLRQGMARRYPKDAGWACMATLSELDQNSLLGAVLFPDLAGQARLVGTRPQQKQEF